MANDNRIQTSVYFTPEVKEYIKLQAEKLGMSESAFISLAVTTYRQQADAINAMSKMDEFIKALKQSGINNSEAVAK